MEEQFKTPAKEIEQNDTKPINKTKKLFINNLDSYHGRAILEVCCYSLFT